MEKMPCLWTPQWAKKDKTMTTITETIQLAVINCGRCGGSYAINERYRREREENSGHWHCPYCECSWGYFEGELQRTRKELENTQAQLRSSKCETLAERNLRETAERKLRRVKNGVCPCCKRHFTNLERHMKTKHPEAKKT